MNSYSTSFLVLITSVAVSTLAGDVPRGAIAIPLQRANNLSYYVAEFQVGTPPQNEYLTIDTGSPTFSFLNPRNKWCETNARPCSRYGTFDNTTSSTSLYSGPGFSDDVADGGFGDLLNDTIIIGGVTVPHMHFGYLSEYAFGFSRISNPTEAIAGLTVLCDNSTAQTCSYTGPFLLPQLKNASAINHMAASFYLGPDNANNTNSEMILGGAYDKAKMAGQPMTLKMIGPSKQSTNSVNVTGLTVRSGHDIVDKTFGDVDRGQTVLMDTGNNQWDVPYPIYNPIWAALGRPNISDPDTNTLQVPCGLRHLSACEHYINVTFAGSSGVIQVPIGSLVADFGNGRCGTFLSNSSSTTLGAFGAPFLRSTYAIFDAENLEITFAQAKHTNATEYVRLPRAGFGK